MTDLSKIYLGAQMPSYTGIKDGIEQNYLCTETKLDIGHFPLRRTRLFKQNYVEVNGEQSNMAFIREDWNGKGYTPSTIHRRSTSTSFDHFLYGKNGQKFGSFKENGVVIVYEDKNNNNRFDTEEAWYYNEQGQKKYLF